MEPHEIFSKHLDANLIVLPGLLDPVEAEVRVLPFLKAHPEYVKDKEVLDIATGTGVIGLYAARLGAKRVVATDINSVAVDGANENAKRLSLDDRFEARLVSGGELGAFSAMGPEESFDAIVSNPPFSLDLESQGNNIWIDRGDLGFSLMVGLENHLRNGGVAVLFYGSLFYHQLMVKFARYLGYEVETADPDAMTPWERDAVFNSYLRRFLERHGIPNDAFCFNWQEEREKHQPAIQRHMNERSYKGLILVKKGQ